MDQTLAKTLESTSRPVPYQATPARFSWTPWLTVSGGLFLLFLFLTWLMLSQGFVQALDLTCRDSMREHAGDHVAVRNFFWLVTWFGGVAGLTLLASAGVMTMFLRKQYLLAGIWLLATAGGALVNLGVKYSVHNPRPAVETRDASVAWLSNPSFPSGHAMGSAIGWGMCFFVAMRFLHGRARMLSGTCIILLILLVGVSRIYLRAHWASDVLGGFILGAGWLIFCLALYEWARRSAIEELKVFATAPAEPVTELIPQAGQQEV